MHKPENFDIECSGSKSYLKFCLGLHYDDTPNLSRYQHLPSLIYSCLTEKKSDF